MNRLIFSSGLGEKNESDINLQIKKNECWFTKWFLFVLFYFSCYFEMWTFYKQIEMEETKKNGKIERDDKNPKN